MLSPRSTSEKRWRAGLYGHRARENVGLDRRRERMDRAGAHRAVRPPELPEPSGSSATVKHRPGRASAACSARTRSPQTSTRSAPPVVGTGRRSSHALSGRVLTCTPTSSPSGPCTRSTQVATRRSRSAGTRRACATAAMCVAGSCAPVAACGLPAAARILLRVAARGAMRAHSSMRSRLLLSSLPRAGRSAMTCTARLLSRPRALPSRAHRDRAALRGRGELVRRARHPLIGSVNTFAN
jgi:hypothetical protein